MQIHKDITKDMYEIENYNADCTRHTAFLIHQRV